MAQYTQTKLRRIGSGGVVPRPRIKVFNPTPNSPVPFAMCAVGELINWRTRERKYFKRNKIPYYISG